MHTFRARQSLDNFPYENTSHNCAHHRWPQQNPTTQWRQGMLLMSSPFHKTLYYTRIPTYYYNDPFPCTGSDILPVQFYSRAGRVPTASQSLSSVCSRPSCGNKRQAGCTLVSLASVMTKLASYPERLSATARKNPPHQPACPVPAGGRPLLATPALPLWGGCLFLAGPWPTLFLNGKTAC